MQYLWPFFWAVSLICGVLNIIAARKWKSSTALKLIVVSLVFGLLAMLSEYALVDYWVAKEDWSALMDVVPGMYGVLTAAVLLCEALNVVAAIILLKRKK